MSIASAFRPPPRCRWLRFALLLVPLFAGCRTEYGADDQRKLAELYYSGRLDEAAELATAISENEADSTGSDALLWHLESGNVNLDAGRSEESMRSLDRAEKLLYGYDSEGRLRLHEIGASDYTGTLADRLTLHLLKGFNYLNSGRVEDFLVEIRRMRHSQFRYLLRDSDAEMRRYDIDNHGRADAPTLAVSRALADGERATVFKAASGSDYQEYSQRRRPALSILFNPLAFYLSAVGYYLNNEWDEALIDLNYLNRIDPENALFRRDLKTLSVMLGDPVPAGLEAVDPDTGSPGDQVVYIIYAQGRPCGWKDRQAAFHLPGQVPASWKFSLPDYRRFDGGRLTARSGGRSGAGVPLADMGEIMREEFWQRDISGLIDRAVAVTRSTTIAHEAAKVQLAAALAMADSDFKPLAVALARAQVAATSRAIIRQTDWRRWLTVPRHYQLLRLPLGEPGQRSIELQVLNRDGRVIERREFTPSDDANRVFIYVRELDGSRRFKFWESLE